jgi:hypothetical protein
MVRFATADFVTFVKALFGCERRCSMDRRSNVRGKLITISANLFSAAMIASCAPAIHSVFPPESYRGPRAEQPLLQAGDFWVFELANATQQKSTGLYPNIEYPLWVGKTWSYEGEARRANLPPTSTASPLRTRIDCYAGGFNQVSVRAGSFGAFQCDCQCHLLTGIGSYEDGCGDWTLWYAPEVKNIIKRKTDSTATSLELIEYRLARPATPGPKLTQDDGRKASVATGTMSR